MPLTEYWANKQLYSYKKKHTKYMEVKMGSQSSSFKMVQCPNNEKSQTQNMYNTNAYKSSAKPCKTVLHVAMDAYLCGKILKTGIGIQTPE